MPDATPEGVDLARLRGYFAEHVPEAGDHSLTAELIAGGRSNLTYSVSNGDRTWVLRRPPLGHVLPTAHDMVREYKVLSALAGTGVPVPRTYALCEDLSVNDAPFYVMEKVDGIIYRDAAALTTVDPVQARRLSEELVDVLAQIHLVDYEQVGLGEFGHPDGFLERQVRRWGQQWDRSKTRELPAVDEIVRRLNAALPESGPPAIVHGDYRLDNTMMAVDDPGKIVAVLDWEMSTLGDPLADLGLFLLYWGNAGAQIIATGSAIDVQAGFLTSDEIVERYAQQSGRPVDSLDWYVVFAFYKLAIIVEGIHARFKMGKTLGEGFDAMGETVDALINGAMSTANRSSIPALRGEVKRVTGLQWVARPQLRDPVLVAAFTGWNDAGDAASDAVAWLAAHYAARPFASIDPDEHYDFQANRPDVELVDGVTRRVSWPTLEFAAAPASGADTDLVLLSGPEPNLRWRVFCDTVIEVARETGCRSVVTFGALLADTPHSAPIHVTGSTTDPARMEELGLEPSRYEGPTGIVGVLHDTCRNAGLASASFWAPVPHYVATPPNPPATRALLDRFATYTHRTLDLRELGVASEAWRARVDGAVASDDEMRDYVRALEEQSDPPSFGDDEVIDEIPSGDDLAEAFEEYLREQGLE